MTELKKFSEEIRMFLACSPYSEHVEGAMIREVSNKRHLIPVAMKDGSKFGITIEVIE